MTENPRFGMREELAKYESAPQNIRVMSEDWVAQNTYCVCCDNDHLTQFSANRPVADFYCDVCFAEFELKASKSKFGNKIVDGAYSAMIERVREARSPHLMLLQYDKSQFSVHRLAIIPNTFLTKEIIEKRKPLSSTARRAGWVGCNILFSKIPRTGVVEMMSNDVMRTRVDVREEWRRATNFSAPNFGDGWLFQVMRCVEQISTREFSLPEIYAFEAELSSIFPTNKNIRPKIRQQLQKLRDLGEIIFLGNGYYQKTK